MKCGFNKYMGLFVPLYGPFCACLKRAMLVPAHGPRPRPKPDPALKYFVLCHAWAVLFSVLRAGPSGSAQMYTYKDHPRIPPESPRPTCCHSRTERRWKTKPPVRVSLSRDLAPAPSKEGSIRVCAYARTLARAQDVADRKSVV